MSNVDELNRIIKVLPNNETVLNMNVLWQKANHLCDDFDSALEPLENIVVLFEEDIDKINMQVIFEHTHLYYAVHYFCSASESLFVLSPSVFDADGAPLDRYFSYHAGRDSWVDEDTGDVLSSDILLALIKDWLLSLN